MKKGFLCLVSVLMLAGCGTIDDGMQRTLSLANTASKPKNQEQAKLILTGDSRLNTILIFVPELDFDSNGEKLRVMLNDETIALVPPKHGIKLAVLPNQTYKLRYGQDEEDIDYWMSRKVKVFSLEAGTFKAYDVFTDWSDPGTANVVRLNLDTTLKRLDEYPLVSPEVPMKEIATGYDGYQKSIDDCLQQNEFEPCKSVVHSIPEYYLPERLLTHTQKIENRELQQQQYLTEMEEALPVKIRRDKYMVQLSRYLKEKNYTKALEVFPKLDALPVTKDPSINFYYGEALLKTGQPKKALEKLYKYITEQGNRATHYAKALELANQAEGQL